MVAAGMNTKGYLCVGSLFDNYSLLVSSMYSKQYQYYWIYVLELLHKLCVEIVYSGAHLIRTANAWKIVPIIRAYYITFVTKMYLQSDK